MMAISRRLTGSNFAGLLLVLSLHGAALYGLWRHGLIPSPPAAATLFVNFIAAPEPQKSPAATPLPTPPKLRLIEQPQLRQLVAETPVSAPTDDVAPAPAPQLAPQLEPVEVAPPLHQPPPAAPVALTSELSVACAERPAPGYPAASRRLAESGMVVLRVELNENGQVVAAKVQSTSGYSRLDEAALSAVRSWRCTPASRNGQAVRAVALQPFNFVIQGN